jgi:hypothetical protein
LSASHTERRNVAPLSIDQSVESAASASSAINSGVAAAAAIARARSRQMAQPRNA